MRENKERGLLIGRIVVSPAGLRALSLVVILALSSCAPAPPTSTVPVTIALAAAWGFGEQTEYFLIQGFQEACPHVTIELVDTWSNPDVFQTQLGWSQEMQVLIVSSSSGDTSLIQRPPSPLSLDPLIDQDPSLDLADFYPGILQGCVRDGETLLLPAGMDVLVMYYNLDLYDQYGVPYPEPGWTWDDFLDLAVTLRDPEAGVFGFAPGSLADVLPFVYQNGGQIADSRGRPALDDPATVQAVRWYAGLIHVYGVAPTPEQAQEVFACEESGESFEDCVEQGVGQGRVAMWIGWYSERGGLGRRRPGRDWPDNWGMAVLPRGVQPATLASVSGFSVSSDTTSIEASWDLVSFLSHQASWRLIPARRSLAESSAYEEQLMVGPEIARVARDSMENTVVLSEDEVRWLDLLTEAFDQVISGQATAEQALAEAQRLAEAEMDGQLQGMNE